MILKLECLFYQNIPLIEKKLSIYESFEELKRQVDLRRENTNTYSVLEYTRIYTLKSFFALHSYSYYTNYEYKNPNTLINLIRFKMFI